MTPTAVLVLVIGVLVVLAVAGIALVVDARRRRRARSLPGAPQAEAPARGSPWTEPIDTARAQQDPPTVATQQDPDGRPHPGR